MSGENLDDVLASHVNEEVIVFMGSTTGELMSTAALSSLIIIPLSVIIGMILGNVTMMFTLSLVFVLAAIVMISRMMQYIKRGRPEGYFVHVVALFKHKFNIKKCNFVVEDGLMGTTRTKQSVVLDLVFKIGEYVE